MQAEGTGRSVRRRLRSLTLILVALLGACTALPDVGPFNEATILMRSATAGAGDLSLKELKTTRQAGASDLSEANAKKLEAALASNKKSLDALVDYTASLQAIVDSGNSGADSARALLDSVTKLAGAAGAPMLPGASEGLVKLAGDTVAFVYGEIARHLAAQRLEEALDAMAPSMAKLVTLLDAQLGDLEGVFALCIAAQVDHLNAGTDGGYGDWLKKQTRFDVLKLGALRELEEALAASPANATKVKEATARLAQVDAALKSVAPKVAEHRQKMDAVIAREVAGKATLLAARSALRNWIAAHEALVKAVKGRQPFSATSLAAAAAEAKTLYERWRTL